MTVTYEVTVHTKEIIGANTFNNVFIKLWGLNGESERTWLVDQEGTAPFYTGAVSTFTVSCPASLGKLVLIELNKQSLSVFPADAWFPAKVEVKSPEGTYHFPIYRWISDTKMHSFREGTALKVFEDTSQLGRYFRQQELWERTQQYRWAVYAEGIPHTIDVNDPSALPAEIQFSFNKETQINYTEAKSRQELDLETLGGSTKEWTDIDLINRVFSCKVSPISAYVQKHWKEDAFFGSLYLNGVNPRLIRRCTVLPKNFPVNDNMVFPCGQSSLAEEMKKGNIFLCDYKNFDGVKANIIRGKQQYLAAPLVLLHRTPDNKMMPIAIQLKQTPANDNPIFLPTDSEYDWLMAKIFVRSAEFSEHQLNTHLLRTHLLAEVFAVSLLRNLPMVHPLHKLLIPHIRYTLHINILARVLLISDGGYFKTYTSSGGEGLSTILQKSLASVTYTSLCIPDDIADRGLENVKNFYYKDDGLRLWAIIHEFVERILSYYYKSDDDVQRDTELQKWIQEIFEHGFLSQTSSGIPQKFSTVAELTKFVTMVIFTGTGQHSAVNTGQFEYGSWMPNSPSTLQCPPPTTKWKMNEATMLQTLPDVGTTVNSMAIMWLLSKQSSDFVPLGHYPDDHFTEEVPCRIIRDFQNDLKELSKAIKCRNNGLEAKYTYMDPEVVENSIAV